MWSRQTRQLIEIAVAEDLGPAGDITAALLPNAGCDVTARLVPRQAGVIAGLSLGPLICDVFSKHLGQPLQFSPGQRGESAWQDGDPVEPGLCVAQVRGRHEAVLSVERTLLNFVGRMSGVATLTRRYVEAAQRVNPDVKVLDTRKTVPGWRELDKYAVRVGGGRNHRLGLYDAVLLKDNHLAGVSTERLADHLANLLSRLAGHPAFVEVEVDSLEQFAQVCTVPGIDIVLLDNFRVEQLRAAVRHRDQQSLRGKLALEASGGITLDNIGDVAATGVDRISIGALTHAAAFLDIALDL